MKFDVVEETTHHAMLEKPGVEVDLILHDGTRLRGALSIDPYEEVQDLLNDPRPFFPLTLESGETVSVNKSSVAICKTLGPED